MARIDTRDKLEYLETILPPTGNNWTIFTNTVKFCQDKTLTILVPYAPMLFDINMASPEKFLEGFVPKDPAFQICKP